MKRAIILLLLFFLGLAEAQTPSLHITGQVSGIVIFPDGSPVAGATVEAVTICKDEPFHLVQEVTTGENGEFNIPPSGSCAQLRLSAKKGLWLKTGQDVFYGKQIGTTPVVQLNGTQQRVEIRLGEMGGRVDVRVWDRATQRFVYADLSIKRMPVPGLKFGFVEMTATGQDGSAGTLILPAGTYEFSVDGFACGTQKYYARHPVREQVHVSSGKILEKDISIDVRNIRASQSYNNPSGEYCKP